MKYDRQVSNGSNSYGILVSNLNFYYFHTSFVINFNFILIFPRYLKMHKSYEYIIFWINDLKKFEIFLNLSKFELFLN